MKTELVIYYSSGVYKGSHAFVLQMTELNTLKVKVPTDLWKEDLAAFTEELEVNEMIISL